jgi:hypothetical protein
LTWEHSACRRMVSGDRLKNTRQQELSSNASLYLRVDSRYIRARKRALYIYLIIKVSPQLLRGGDDIVLSAGRITCPYPRAGVPIKLISAYSLIRP